ncbi:MAG: DUF1491 family protein [Pseudomonadota bacterium]
MDSARLPTHLIVSALVRRANLVGVSAFILQKGDAERGDLLVKVARLDGTALALRPGHSIDGGRVFQDLALQGVGPDEAGVDAYIARAQERDGDLWIVEIEDRNGRHFLDDPVEFSPNSPFLPDV